VHRSEIFPLTSGSGQNQRLPHCNTDDRFTPINRHYPKGSMQAS
jgi:hypothetical protein